MRISKRFSQGAVSAVSQALGVGAVLGALALALGLASSVALAQNESVPASWQQHRKTFTYIGISPTYSCEGMRNALSFLLQQSGAKLNHPINVSPCNGGGPSVLPSADLNFSTLQATQDKGGSGSENAVWRHVEFSLTRSNPQLLGSDCELVSEFKDKLLPMFTTRNVTSKLRCLPHQTTGNQFDLSFDVLASADAGRHVGGAG